MSAEAKVAEERSVLARVVTRSQSETEHLARLLGELVESGCVIGLSGVLGAGKTAFVRGLCAGMRALAPHCVTSPTYTLVHEYPTDPPLYHLDFYRLGGIDDLESIGYWDFIECPGVMVIEWSERAVEQLPTSTLHVRLDVGDSSEEREIVVRAADDNTRRLAEKWVARWQAHIDT